MIKKQNKTIKEKGFTILETLVAIFVLVLAITGPLVFSQSSLRSSFEARDRITAFFLAQDVIEYVKNRRDECALDALNPSASCNSLSTIPWITDVENNFDVCVDASGGCAIDTVNDSVAACSESANDETCNLFVDSANPQYFSHDNSGGTEFSRFRREIYIDQLDDSGSGTENNEAEITVVIEWGRDSENLDNRLVVQENIKNWIPGSPTE
jgi:Tfp pilus assembly protein PilV